MHNALKAYFFRKQPEIVKMSQKCHTNLILNYFQNISNKKIKLKPLKMPRESETDKEFASRIPPFTFTYHGVD